MAFGLLRAVHGLHSQRTVNQVVMGKRRDALDFCWDIAEAALSHRLWEVAGYAPERESADLLFLSTRGTNPTSLGRVRPTFNRYIVIPECPE